MTARLLRLATRSSPLALQQAHQVKQRINALHPDINIELVTLTTTGDQQQHVALHQLGGKSVFVKTLQTAVLNNQADFAVHCIKDMSVNPSDGLELAAILPRAAAEDVWVSEKFPSIADFPENGVIGTSSPRRTCQIKAALPHCRIALCRGNINTRITHLIEGRYDAIILAHAGLIRLGITQPSITALSMSDFIPAIGQGALGIECRVDDPSTKEIVSQLNDPETQDCVIAERQVNRLLGGDCQSAVAAHAFISNNTLHLNAMVGHLKDFSTIGSSHSMPRGDSMALGNYVAQQLIKQGAREYLKYQPT